MVKVNPEQGHYYRTPEITELYDTDYDLRKVADAKIPGTLQGDLAVCPTAKP